jgi:membrane-associated phospholipid phosphatase
MLLAAGPGLAQTTDSPLVAELKRDDRIDAWVQNHRSKQSDNFARVVTPFGSWAAIGVSAGITTPLLKYAVGRVRPSDGADADEFKPFSGNSSSPSGHATEAFAVASMLSARADGLGFTASASF